MRRKYTESSLVTIMRWRDEDKLTWEAIAEKLGSTTTQALRWYRIGQRKELEMNNWVEAKENA